MMATEFEECMNWIFKQQDIIESIKYGKNQRAVKDAIDEIQTRSNIIRDYQKEVDKAIKKVSKQELKDMLDKSYTGLRELSNKKLNNLVTLLEIVSLEDTSGSVTNEFDMLATDLVRPEQRVKVIGQDTGGHIPGFVSSHAQESIFATRDSWRWMQNFVKCTGVHLKNAAQYHQFFQYSDEMEDHITKDVNHLTNLFFSEEDFKGDYADAKRLLQELDDLLKALRQWETKTTLQWEQATRVLPVHMRTEGVPEPTPIRALCEYETKEIHIRDGEDLLLLESTDPNSWKVRNCRGQEAEVPAVVCLIPGPFAEAIEAAVRLRMKLITVWTDTLKIIGSRLIAFMLVVFKEKYRDDEKELIQSIPEEERNELLRIMTYIDDTLRVHWLDDENFQTLQERLEVPRNIIDEVKGQPGKEKPGHLALVVQMSMIEKLMDKYKLLEHDRYMTLIQLILHETKLQKGDPVRQEVWRDWLTYKEVLETVNPADLLLVVGKWEELSTRQRSDVSLLLDEHLKEILEKEEKERLAALEEELKRKEREEKEKREKEEREKREKEERERKEREERERKEQEERERKEREERERKEKEEKERKEKEERERKEREEKERKEKEEKERKEREERERKEREEKERKEKEEWERKEKEEKERKEREERERKEREEKEKKEKEERERKEKEEKERKEREEKERKEREERERKEKEEKERKEKEERERKEKEERERKEKEERERKEREERERKEKEERERKEREEKERKEKEERERKEREEQERKEKEERERKEKEERERKEREEKERKEREEKERKEREEEERKKKEEIDRLLREKEEQETKERLEREEMERALVGMPDEDETSSEASDSSSAHVRRKIAATQEIASSELEEKKTFVITAVFDSRSGKKISLDDAIKAGIIQQEKGIYKNLKTGEELIIPVAMNQGLIEVGQTKVRRGKEKKSTVGLVTVSDPDGIDDDITYAIKSVVDARTKRHLTFQEAVQRGIINKEEGAYHNTATEEIMDIGDAIQHGLLIAQVVSDPRTLEVDPANKMVSRERMKKRVLRSISAISALKKAASMESLSTPISVTEPDEV